MKKVYMIEGKPVCEKGSVYSFWYPDVFSSLRKAIKQARKEGTEKQDGTFIMPTQEGIDFEARIVEVHVK